MVEAVRDRLGQVGDVSRGRAKRTEARLEVGENIVRLREESETGKDHFFEETRKTGRNGDGTIRRRTRRRFTRFENGDDFGLLPLRRELGGGPAAIEKREKVGEGFGREVFKKGKRNRI